MGAVSGASDTFPVPVVPAGQVQPTHANIQGVPKEYVETTYSCRWTQMMFA